jgi:uncharacterized protein YgiM (DUF1202 family)
MDHSPSQALSHILKAARRKADQQTECHKYQKGEPKMSTYNGQVTGGGLNLRASASTSAALLIQIPDKTQIVVSDYSGDSGWYCTTYSGNSGFVMKQYVTILNAANSKSCSVTGGGLNLRLYPSTSAPSHVQIPDSSPLTVQEHNDQWSSTTYSGNSGFVMTKYLTGGGVTPPAEGWRYGQVIAIPDVNIRTSPSTYGTIMGRWQNNRIGIVSAASTAGWYLSNWKGKAAYVSMQYIHDNGAASSVIPERMISIAKNEVGLAEPDAYKYYGIASGTEWCQLFVNWLALQAGMSTSLVPNTASTPKGIEWHIVNGNRFWFVSEENKAKMREYSTAVSSNTVAGLTAEEKAFIPQAGDFIYFRWNDHPEDHCSHVGFVNSVDTADSTLITVEGNVSNKVVSRHWALSHDEIVGYGRLEFEKEENAL